MRASGEPLPMRQEDVKFSGHAIEVRLCAEDAARGFIPQSGTIALWHMPPQLRVEHAMRAGARIPPFYDSMIAKMISHGEDRDVARRKLLAGLEDAVALGVTTNQAFLQRCLGHEVFAAGGATTAFVGQHQDALLAPDAVLQRRAAAIAAVLLYETLGDRPRPLGRRMTHSLPVSLRFEQDGQPRIAGIVLTGQNHFEVDLQGSNVVIELDGIVGHTAYFICDGLFERAALHRDGNLLLLHYRGVPMRIEDKTRTASARQSDAGGDGKLRASMNGRVVAVLAAVGDTVEVGQPVVTLEAMKMEHIHAAPLAGRIAALHVKTGDQVAASRVVAEIESAVKQEAAL